MRTVGRCHAGNADFYRFLNRRLSAFENQRYLRSKFLQLLVIKQ